jgi:hypothetical protein
MTTATKRTTKSKKQIRGTHQTAVLKTTEAQQQAHFSQILSTALTEPGRVNAAYRAFHNFSLGNQMLAAEQLFARGLDLSPIASFNTWRERGRAVQKGQKAISLFMPITVKREDKESGEEYSFAKFIMRPNWFSLDQTAGADYTPEVKTPAWDPDAAMVALDIEETHFSDLRGNVQGYATGRRIAINPVATLKHKTRFHELAHVVLGHTLQNEMNDGELTPRDLMEVEAEGAAYLLCTLLDLPGQAESRAYIQGWLRADAIPEKSAQRIFSAANKILAAGQLAATA